MPTNRSYKYKIRALIKEKGPQVKKGSDQLCRFSVSLRALFSPFSTKYTLALIRILILI